MYKFIYSLIIFLCCFNSGLAQNTLPDSLKTAREKAIYLNELAKKQNKLDSILLITWEAIEYATQCDCDSLLNASYYHLSYYPVVRGEYDLAIKNMQFLDSLLKINNDDYYTFRKYTLNAYAYKMKDQLEIGLDNYKKALNASFKLGDSLFIADAYNNVGDAFMSMELNKEAKKYFLLAINIFEKNEGVDNRKHITYNNLSRTSKSLKDIEYYSQKAFDIIKENPNPYQLAIFYAQRADAYKANEFYKESIVSNQLAYKVADSIGYDLIKNIALIFLGEANLKLGKVNLALDYLEQASTMEQPNVQNHQILLQNLSKVYAAKGNFKNAYVISEKLYSIKDSISVLRSSNQFAEFDVKFKTAQKDKEIAQQQLEIAKQKNTRNYWIFGSLGFILIGFSLFQWRNNKQKRERLLAESKYQNEQEINGLRTKFLGNIAHEIRTPLTLISGNLVLAKENINHRDKALKNIDVALLNSKKVVEDANGILELLKFEKNKTTIKCNSINLDETLRRIFFSFVSLAEIKHIDLDYQSSISKELSIKTDVEKMEKILNNLLSNAIKYSPSNSKIIFKAIVENESLTIKVTDFGQGIHYNETEKIFERFYQSSDSQSVGGIGIGLSLAKEFAELLNGTLSVESELEKGSTFIFTLPIVESVIQTKQSEGRISKQELQENPQVIRNDISLVIQSEAKNLNITQEDKNEEITSKTGINKSKVLIVEDNPEMCNYLVEILSDKYDCTTSFDGLEAFKKIEKETFDLITSDIMMPKLNGFQLREKLNENDLYKNIPFILISAKTLEEDKIKGFQLGIDDYIVKPFNKNELIARIDNLLDNKDSREHWKLQNENIEPISESSDKILLKKIEEIIIENISDEHFKVTELASAVGYSQRQLSRILKQYTGMSPVKFILEIRLQKAYKTLQNKTFFTLSEVRYDVGILTSSYFNKKFNERFGINPSELLS